MLGEDTKATAIRFLEDNGNTISRDHAEALGIVATVLATTGYAVSLAHSRSAVYRRRQDGIRSGILFSRRQVASRQRRIDCRWHHCSSGGNAVLAYSTALGSPLRMSV